MSLPARLSHLVPRRGEAPLPASGDFVRLPDGVTHYQTGGPQTGAPVVLVHGFSVPYFIWDPTFEFLTAGGFRVLRYDLLGRGFSERPARRYTLDLFVQQLRDLLDALGWAQPVALLGLSMGGPITAAFTARYPQRVARLGLIDPAGGGALSFPRLLRWLGRVPALGEHLLALAGEGRLTRGIGDDFYDKSLVEAFVERYRLQLHYRGFLRAILSTVGEGVLGEHLDVYRRVGTLGLPVLLIWGEYDATIPIAQAGALREAMPQARYHVIPESGHIPHYEHPEMVNPLLQDFLEG